MLTKISKTLTVVIFVISVAFFGFAFMAYFIGPDWQSHALRLDEYEFAQANPAAPWTAKSRDIRQESYGQGKSLPEAINAAQKKILQEQQQKIQTIEQSLPGMQAALEQARQAIDVDVKAISARAQELEAQRVQVAAAVADLERQADAKAKQADGTAQVVKLRYQELLRLRNELEELKSQAAAAVSEEARLRDLLYQVEGDLERVKRRQQLLKSDSKQYE
jgi:chromosome segregation ATPase